MKKQKRKNLRRNLSSIYMFIAVFFVLGFIFFGTSKLFLKERVPVNQTALHETFELNANETFTINRWVYDEEKNMMEVILMTNGIQDIGTELNFTSVSKTNLKQELPIHVVFQDNDMYVLHLKKIPKSFDQVAVRLVKSNRTMAAAFDEKESSMDDEKIVSTIYTDERVVQKEEVNERDQREYIRLVTDEMMGQTKKEQLKLDTLIQRVENYNEELQEEIETLKSDLLYQTEDEQLETNNDIYRLERDIEQNKREVETMKEDYQSLAHKLERLEQKKRDAGL